MHKDNPKISIIVTTKNEEKNLGILCESVNAQTYTNWELIIVDNFSTDKTKEVALGYTRKFFEKGPERSIQRNFGVSKAIGAYVVILDADMTLEPSVLFDCVNVLGKKNADVLIIPEKSYGSNFWAKCRALERDCYIGDESIEAARVFSKKVYLDLGGFDENMISGEDWDLTLRARRAGYKVSRINSFIHHNEGNLSYFGSIKKKYYYSKKADDYIAQNVTSLKDILLYLIRPAYIRNWRILIKDPLHTLGFLFLKYSEFFVGGFFAIVFKKSFLKKLRIIK